MKKKSSESRPFLRTLVMLGLMVPIISFFSSRGFAQDQWPQEFPIQDGKIFVYQPQLESFKGDKIKGRAAISFHKKDEKEPALRRHLVFLPCAYRP